MSLLFPTTQPSIPAVERVTPAQTDPLFNFKPGTVDDLTADLSAPKQPFDIPNFSESAPETPEQSEMDLKREASEVAGQVIDLLDGGASFLLSLIDKTNVKAYRLDRTEKATIKPHLAEYLKGKSVDIPPGFMLVFVLVMIYGPKIMQAMGNRKVAKGPDKGISPQPDSESKVVNFTDNRHD